jgi:hypothetical protein
LSSIFLTCWPTANVVDVRRVIPENSAGSHIIRREVIVFSLQRI